MLAAEPDTSLPWEAANSREGSKETAQYKDVFTGGWKATLAHSEVPEGPALGVDISTEFLREYEWNLKTERLDSCQRVDGLDGGAHESE